MIKGIFEIRKSVLATHRCKALQDIGKALDCTGMYQNQLLHAGITTRTICMHLRILCLQADRVS
jgi:hypothetical protein